MLNCANKSVNIIFILNDLELILLLYYYSLNINKISKLLVIRKSGNY